MAKLKVTAFKKSGKYYTEETYDLKDYPNLWSYPNEQSVGYIRNEQSKYTYDLWNRIKLGQEDWLCPVSSGFKGFVFVFEGIFENGEQGFLTYLLDRTKYEIEL